MTTVVAALACAGLLICSCFLAGFLGSRWPVDETLLRETVRKEIDNRTIWEPFVERRILESLPQEQLSLNKPICVTSFARTGNETTAKWRLLTTSGFSTADERSLVVRVSGFYSVHLSWSTNQHAKTKLVSRYPNIYPTGYPNGYPTGRQRLLGGWEKGRDHTIVRLYANDALRMIISGEGDVYGKMTVFLI